MATRSVILKRTAIGAGVAVVLLVVLIALLPALINAGLGHGAVRSAIEGNLAPGSRADFQALSTTWRGPQEIRGLRIVDPQGKEVADVNMRISPGLWGLLFGTFGVLEANVSGTVNGELYEDGTTNLQHVFAADPDPARQPMEGVPPLILRVDALHVLLTQIAQTEQRQVAIRDLAGFLTYSPATAASQSEVSFEFAAQTLADDVQGDLRLTGRSQNLFDTGGAFTPEGAPLNVSLNASNVPVLGMDVPTLLTHLVMSVHADNLGQLVSMNVESEAVIQDEPPSRFRAEVNVRVPFRPDGTLDMTLENIAATASGERVPSSLIQPILAATPIVLTRDVGRSIDLDAQVSPAAGTAVIRATGPRASLDVSARHDAETGWWTGDRLVLTTPQAHPDLVHGFTNLTVDRHVNLEINMTQFRFPPLDPVTETRPLSQYGGSGVLRINEPVALLFEAATAEGEEPSPRTVLLDRGEIEFDSPSLGDYLDLAGSLHGEGATVRVQQRITNIFDQAGDMDAMMANFVGEVTVDGLPSATVAQWVPDQQAVIAELLGPQVNLSLTTNLDEAGLRGTIVASGAQTQANVELLRRPDALEISRTFADFTLTPALVQLLQDAPADADGEPIALLAPAAARLEIDSITLPGTRPDEYRLDQLDFAGRLLVDDLAVSGLPGLAEPVSVHDMSARILATLARDPFAETPAAGPGEAPPPLLASYSLEGGAGVRHYTDGSSVANVAYNVTGRPAHPAAEEQTQIDGSLALTEIDVPNIERLIGREPGQFELWLGRTGALNAQFSAVGQRYEATLVSDTPRLQGTFAASLADDLLELNTDAASLLLGADALAQILGGADARIVVERDVPGTLSLVASMPLGFITQEPFEPTLLDIRAEMRGGPLAMRIDNERQTLENIHLSMTADAFSDGVDFHFVLEGDSVETTAAAPGAPAPPPGAIGAPPAPQPQQRDGNVSVRGTVHEPVVPGRALTFEDATLNLDATFNRAPTAIADAFLQMNGRLVAIVGAHIDGTITARDLARGQAAEGGTLTADLRSPHGFLRGSGIGRGGALHFTQDAPIEAELEITPLMRDLVLTRLHPIFADLFTAESPLTATFVPAAIPLDGDVSKLSGDAQITIGTVFLDQRSPMFGILALPRLANIGGLPGLPSAMSAIIDPITLRIRDGVIDYDRFIMHINDTEMPFTGRINLVTGAVNVRTVMPLGLLQIRELERIMPREAEGLQVPLVARGSIGETLRLEVDPEFDLAGQLLRMGLERGVLDRILPRNGNGRDPGDILRDILRPPRRDD